MSGHSKWHQIKHKKAVTDGRRSQLFARLAKDIAIAARTGRDPAQNPLLREAIARAKKANVPQNNIDRLLNTPPVPTTTLTYEGFGPGGAALLMVCTTDNPNRTVAEVRAILKNHDGSLGAPGNVQWKFVPIVTATLPLPPATTRSQIELQLIEAGVQNIDQADQTLIVTAPLHARLAVSQALADQAYRLQATYHTVPDNQITLTDGTNQQLQALVTALLDHPDVDDIYTDAVA